MKLSPSYGLIVLTETDFRLLTYKKINQTDSLLFNLDASGSLTNLDLESDEERQACFINCLINLQTHWSDRYLREGHKIKKWYVLVPTYWLLHIRKNLPHIGSNYLLSLASLSAISESIRLSPETLCYGYQEVKGEEPDLFDIYGCPLEWLTRIRDVCCQVDILNLHAYDPNNVYSIQTLQQLITIEVYQPLKWQQQKQMQLLKILLASSAFFGIVGGVSLAWLDHQHTALSEAIQEVTSRYQPLQSTPLPLLNFVSLQKSLMSLSPQIKIVSFDFNLDGIRLEVYGPRQRLYALVNGWKKHWPEVRWIMMDLSSLEKPAIDLSVKYNNKQAQEVLYAIIMGEKSSL
ncbi:hypothetical protein O1D97_06335 [Marinomonas sp. 15G1-11]|uniref:General secretion pathway protein L n=1 Tax=Marinomonas phaeophyticola TaxID=3004091 RepID=A0ABT4JSA6_9GAMM|nr:hypothetical protein [Marinomonas sp. 15G1-11]MCZ2721272.1 hypothetical protein [Marinomonas sp. 15G1-11]